jgi:hypothetical protein
MRPADHGCEHSRGNSGGGAFDRKIGRGKTWLLGPLRGGL